MEQRFKLASHGKTLWTRDVARPLREQVEDRLASAVSGDIVAIDMKGVEAFDFSFANEFFGKLLLSLPSMYPQRFILVEGLTEYTRENLVKALEGLNLAMIERIKKKLVLIGKLHPADTATFEAIAKEKAAVTAATLSSKLSLTVTAVNERLTKLSDLGLLRRLQGQSEAGRKQFEYAVPA
jgi:hypothetical protein